MGCNGGAVSRWPAQYRGMGMMKKKNDWFNGKIAEPFVGTVKFTIIFVPIVLFICFLIFFFVALFYDKVEPAARILLYIMSVLTGISTIGFPIATLRLIRVYPKHRKITKMLLQEYIFKNWLIEQVVAKKLKGRG